MIFEPLVVSWNHKSSLIGWNDGNSYAITILTINQMFYVSTYCLKCTNVQHNALGEKANKKEKKKKNLCSRKLQT